MHDTRRIALRALGNDEKALLDIKSAETFLDVEVPANQLVDLGSEFPVSTDFSDLDKNDNILEEMYMNYSYMPQILNTDNILDIMDARLIIEPVIAQTAAYQQSSDDVQALAAIMEQFRASRHIEETVRCEGDFHEAMAKSTKNRILPLVIKQIFQLITSVELKLESDFEAFHTMSFDLHAKVFEAIKSREAGKAGRFMKEYLLLVQARVNEVLLQELK
jgi:DNA-binding GntR family transcriptional regulator